MTREEAIINLKLSQNRIGGMKKEEWNALQMAIEALQDRPKGDWISCSERLPEVGVEVLTTTDWSDVLIAWLNKDGAWETEEFILANDEILAWMPLPKPYREDGE